MRISLLRALRAPVWSVLGVAAAGCGGGALRLQDITPESVPTLEAQHAAHPQDARAATRLGVGYFRANRLSEARAALDTAAGDPQNGIAAIYLGMTAESQGDFAAARDAYQRYLQVGRSGELRSVARQRLALIGRRQLEFEARQALAQEAELSQSPPQPNTIAVMPFGYSGTNEEIAPLTRGFAQLMVTDLAKSRQVTVLERERMQAVVDELRLGAEGRADPQSAVRSGRLLRAARVVQGSLADVGEDLNVTAAVVDVTTSVAIGAGNRGALDRLFDIEKGIVLDIFNQLGIQLTDAERAAIDQRPTQNLQAFLAWSRGLEAEDRGDFSGARDYYLQAQRLDPSFSAAGQSAQQASDLSTASAQSVGDVDVAATQNAATETGGVTSEQLGQTVQNASNGVNPTTVTQTASEQEVTQTTSPTERDPTSAATNTETIKPTTGTIIIVIRRP